MNNKNRVKSEQKIQQQQWKPNLKDIILWSFFGILFVGQIVLCFLFYNGANLDFLLYLGWATFASSMIIGMLARVAFQEKGKSQKGKGWIHTSVVVESGIYAIVRHPMYLSFILFFLSLILISQHWLSLIFAIPITVYFYLSMGQEEQSSIIKFGDAYKTYMKRVPRINFFLGIIRLLRQD
jgi:protein-S-isoprenylcysteine O-methyltransferase Ste14